MKHVVKFATLAALLVAVSAYAQESSQLRVSMPFGFTAAGTTLPPGEYLLSIDQSLRLVTLSGPQDSVIFPSLPHGPSRQHESLQFLRSGDRWVLKEITVAGAEWDISMKSEETATAIHGSAEQKSKASPKFQLHGRLSHTD
jgi:hypothetical protein